MNYKLDNEKKLTGVLTARNGSGIVETVYMELDNTSAKNLLRY